MDVLEDKDDFVRSWLTTLGDKKNPQGKKFEPSSNLDNCTKRREEKKKKTNYSFVRINKAYIAHRITNNWVGFSEDQEVLRLIDETRNQVADSAKAALDNLKERHASAALGQTGESKKTGTSAGASSTKVETISAQDKRSQDTCVDETVVYIDKLHINENGVQNYPFI